MSSPTQPHIVVTGANGFIGTHVMHALAHAGEYPVGLCRRPTKGLVHGFDLENPGDYAQVLKGAKAVVHCAARVHGREDKATELADHMKANRDGTADLVAQAEAAGVETFIFLSTVAVYGVNASNSVLDLNHPTAPNTAYGKAKLEAEEFVLKSKMRVVILRVPQVYGPHGPGLWGRMLRMANSPYPLPMGFVRNQRSMIAVQNLADLIRHCVQSTDVPSLILATDHADISTTDMMRHLRRAFGRAPRLYLAPFPILWLGAKAMRRSYLYDTYYRSLRFTPTDCGWTPPLSPAEALAACAPKR
ncbi:MAG: NAD-dependent epimerase/dehydratase family protein [Cognatishimia activa]